MVFISASELKYVHQVFGEINRDNNGRITLREMKNYISHKAPNLLPSATSLFNKADKHRQGRVTFDQLMRVLYPSAFPQELKAMIDVARPHPQTQIEMDLDLMEDIDTSLSVKTSCRGNSESGTTLADLWESD